MKKKILIIEDDALQRKFLQELLKHGNFELFTEINGDFIFDILEKFNPDIILMDINLPGENGIEITRKIKNNEDYSNIPVVLISGFIDIHNIQEAEKAGCTGFIQKPVDTRTFVKTIEGYLL